MDKRLAREWFRFGDMDLSTAELKIEHHPQHYEIICYHCQQAVEKYLKGYLFACDVMPPKIHELDKLCVMCAQYDDSFEGIFDRCELLSQYAVQSRYPDEIELNDALTQKALACAQQIKAFAPLRELREKLSEEN